jgi:hypothetical protein
MRRTKKKKKNLKKGDARCYATVFSLFSLVELSGLALDFFFSSFFFTLIFDISRLTKRFPRTIELE